MYFYLYIDTIIAFFIDIQFLFSLECELKSDTYFKTKLNRIMMKNYVKLF